MQGRGGTRRTGGWGLAFVVLLLLGAGMASVPGGDDPVALIRRFYEDHGTVVLVSQVVELLATLPLVLFLLGLAASTLVRGRREALVTGGAVVVTSLLTLVPPLLLVALHDRGSAGQVRALATLSDLTDVLLFAAIAGWAFGVGRARRGPGWLRGLALLVGLLAAGRAVEILLGGALLEVAAPLGFLLLVVALSVLLLRGERRAGPQPSEPSASRASTSSSTE